MNTTRRIHVVVAVTELEQVLEIKEKGTLRELEEKEQKQKKRTKRISSRTNLTNTDFLPNILPSVRTHISRFEIVKIQVAR